MYKSVQSVTFTDEELHKIYHSIKYDYEDYSLRYSDVDDDPDYPGPITSDEVKADLSIFQDILTKIENAGSFSDD